MRQHSVEPTFSERALQNKVDEPDVNTEDNVSGGVNDGVGEDNWVWLYTVKAVQDWFGCALWRCGLSGCVVRDVVGS